jgi:hypothetical protein
MHLAARIESVATRLADALSGVGLSPQSVDIEPDGFAERISGMCPLLVSDVVAVAVLAGVCIADLLPD